MHAAQRLVASLGSLFIANCGLLVGNEDPHLKEPTAALDAASDTSARSAPSAALDAASDARALGEVGSALGEAGLALGEAGLALGEAGLALGEVGSALGEVGSALDAASDARADSEELLRDALVEGTADIGEQLDGTDASRGSLGLAEASDGGDSADATGIFERQADIPDPIGSLSRVSVATGGVQANDSSDSVGVSGDGRLVVFTSFASNLVAGDGNGFADVFQHDRVSGRTTRLSVGSGNAEADGSSDEASISADAQLIAFASLAPNLRHAVDISKQIFQISMIGDATAQWVSHTPYDCRSPVTSGANGIVAAAFVTEGAVVFDDFNQRSDVYLVWGARFKFERISIGRDGADANEASDHPSISADGDVVAFESRASNLVALDTNATRDVFVRIRSRDLMVRVSVDSGGAQGDSSSYDPALSSDGARVAFTSDASNLTEGDTNGVADIFVHDMQTGKTLRASVASNGEEANGPSSSASLSGDGRIVAFLSSATNLDRRFAASPAGPNHQDVFVHDSITGKTYRLAAATLDGRLFPGRVGRPAISADARVVVFPADVPDLVPGDTNARTDVFAYEFSSAPWVP